MQIKKVLIYVFSSLISISAFADQAYMNDRSTWAVKSIAHYLKMKKDFPNQDPARSLRAAQRDMLQFNNSLIVGNGSSTDASIRANAEVDIDYYADECARDKTKATLCKAAETQLAKYKAQYGADYTPKKPAYPEIDTEKYTYTINGKTYDVKNLKYSEAPTRVVSSATVSATAKPATAKDPEYACEWDASLPPRKLLYAPGCSGNSKICSGYVKCNKNGWKINRLATCGAENCNDSTATECAKQKTYGSKTAPAEASATSGPGKSSHNNNANGVN